MKNTYGFTGLFLLLLLAVLLVIGGVGSYLYSRQSGHLATKSTPVSQAPAAVGASTSPNGIPGGASGHGGTSTPVTSPNGTVVKVTPAGFQITVPDSLKDLTYQVNGNVVSFSTASLTAAAPDCAASRGTGAFDTITRGSGVYQPPANPANGGLLKQYSSYYLAYTLPTGPCSKNLSVTAQNVLDDQAQAFYGSLSSVTAL